MCPGIRIHHKNHNIRGSAHNETNLLALDNVNIYHRWVFTNGGDRQKIGLTGGGARHQNI